MAERLTNGQIDGQIQTGQVMGDITLNPSPDRRSFSLRNITPSRWWGGGKDRVVTPSGIPALPIAPADRDDDTPPAIIGSQETDLGEKAIIAEVLPNEKNPGNPVDFDDIGIILKWYEHPLIARHIDVQDFDNVDYQKRFGSAIEYFAGVKDNRGIPTTKNTDSIPYKAVNRQGEIIAVSTARWRWKVDFIPQGRSIVYWEGIMVAPELQATDTQEGYKVGTTYGIDCLDSFFFKSRVYEGGRPASEVRATVFVDVKDYDKVERMFRTLGLKEHGPVRRDDKTGRRIQPFKGTRDEYVEARSEAAERAQPESRDRLRAFGQEIERTLAAERSVKTVPEPLAQPE